MEPLALAKIKTDSGCQPRAGISSEVVDDYAALLIAGTELPPVVVFHDGTDHYLADGYHRFEAHKRIKRNKIPADVRQGTLRDAILFSLGANQAHGLRRSNGDKRRAVERMLRDDEWSVWSDNRIAEHVGVSQPFVSAVRKEVAPPPTNNGYKTDAAAKRVGRDGRTRSAPAPRAPRASSPSLARTSEHAQDTPADGLPVREIEPEFDTETGEVFEGSPAAATPAPESAVQDQAVIATPPGDDGAPVAADDRESLDSDRQVPEPASADETTSAPALADAGDAAVAEADAGLTGGGGPASADTSDSVTANVSAGVTAGETAPSRYLIPRHYTTPQGMVAVSVDPADPQSGVEGAVSMLIRLLGIDGAPGTTGKDAARNWSDNKPLLSDHLTRLADEIIDMDAEFRSKHGAGNDAALASEAA